MSPLIWILLGELLLISLSLCVFYFMTLRKRRQRLLEAMDSLLQQLQQTEPVRLQQLQIQLEAAYRVKGDSVARLSQKLLTEEKAFIRTLLQALVTRDTAALAHLHEFLQRLMDTQIKTIADAISSDAAADKLTEAGPAENSHLGIQGAASSLYDHDSEGDESLPPLFDPDEGDILSADMLAEILPVSASTFSAAELENLDTAEPPQDTLLPPLDPLAEEDVGFPPPLAPSAMDETDEQAFEDATESPHDLAIDSINGDLEAQFQPGHAGVDTGVPQEESAQQQPEALTTASQIEYPPQPHEAEAQAVFAQQDEAGTMVDDFGPEVEPIEADTAGGLPEQIAEPSEVVSPVLPTVAENVERVTQQGEIHEELTADTPKTARKTRKRSAPRAKQKNNAQTAEEAHEQG